MNKRIYFSVETKVRELNARILFAIQASLRNYSTVIGSRGRILKYRKYMQKGIVIFNGITIGLVNELRKFKSLGFSVGNFDEEGLISFSFSHHTFRYDYNMFGVVDFLFAWGEREKDAILHNKLKYYPERKIIVTGNPRLDLIKSKLSVMFDEDSKKINKKYGNFILITTMFPKTNYLQRSNSGNNYLNAITISGYIRRDIDKYIADESVNNENFTRQELMRFISVFSQSFPEKKILIKPHPSENFQTWLDFVQKLKNSNIIVINVNEYQTNSFIKACDFLIASNCTTLVEGFFLDKAVINFIPYENSEVNFELPQVVSYNLATVAELINFLKKNNFLIKRKILSEQEKKVLNYTVKNLDIIDSSKLMLDFFDDNIKLNNIYSDRNYPISIEIFSNIKSRLVEILNLIQNKNNKYKSNLIDYQKQKNPGFTVNELIFRKNLICSILNIDPSIINIKEIYRGLYEFSKLN
jgi:surface carbohydrate biosynthesis protein